MFRRLRAFAFVLLAVTAASSCSPSIDLAASLKVSDVLGGWYDWGLKDGMSKLVPSITFKLTNTGTAPLSGVQVVVAFWIDGGDGESDSKQVQAISTQAVAPGASSDALTVHSDVGYTYAGPRAEMFTNSHFKDATAKLFAKRGGKIVPIGEFKLDRRILPHVADTPGRP